MIGGDGFRLRGRGGLNGDREFVLRDEIMIDCVELMERKILRKDVNWKERMERKKQEDKRQVRRNLS